LGDALAASSSAFGVPGRWAQLLMGVGALISIAGVYEVFTLGLARLSYAMAADGLMPGVFARLEPKSGAPYAGLLFQAACALVAALLFKVGILITAAVFFLGICYVATALASLRLLRQHENSAIRIPALRVLLMLAAVAGVYLCTQTSPAVKAIGTLLMLAGAAVYLASGDAWHQGSAGITARTLELSIEQWLVHREAWLLHFFRRPTSGRHSSH
jgi:APA family basic amino acid/polyamine antiporter